MQLENQVCNLELAKRLKELGVKQKSLFHYSVPVPERAESEIDKKTLKGCATEIFQQEMSKRWGKCFDEFSAFTVAELGEMLEEAEHKDILKAYVHIVGALDTSIITPAGLKIFMHRPNAGASMIIYFLENDLITL